MNRKTLTAFALLGVTSAVLATALPGISVAEAGPKGGMLMQHFDEIDADKDGRVTEAEVEAFRAAQFATADTDKNGSLSAEELVAMHEANAKPRMADRAAKMIGRADDNSDGTLSAEEFAALGQSKSPFERADADGDGAVSKAEAEAAMEMMGKHGKRGKHGKHGHGHDDMGMGDN